MFGSSNLDIEECRDKNIRLGYKCVSVNLVGKYVLVRNVMPIPSSVAYTFQGMCMFP